MKKQKTVITILFIACLMLFNHAKALSKITPALDSQLKNISEQMFQRGNSNFIVVDAIRDGLIKFGSSYEVAYESHMIKIDSIELVEPLKDKYIAKIKNFYTLYDRGTVPCRSMISSVDLKEILDSTCYFRTANEFKEKYFQDSLSETQHKFFSDLLKQVTKDHLADTLDSVHVVYKEANVFINGKKVKKPLADTYNEIAKKDMHYIPSKADKKGLDYFKH